MGKKDGGYQKVDYNLIVLMIIVKYSLQKCISSLFMKNRKQYFFSNSSEKNRFIQAIFSDDLTQISLMAKQQRQNFKMIYNLSGEQLPQEIIEQAMIASLEFVSNQSRKMCKNLIVCQQYLRLINKYYEYFHVGSLQKIRNKALNPNININHLIPTFIHLRNPQIRKTLKQKQHNLLHILCKSKKLTLKQMMRIINTNIYNITDLPLLQRIFYQQIYPRVYEIKEAQQLLQGLSYLHFFNMMPLDLSQNTIEKIKAYLDETTNARELKNDLIWLEVIQTILLKSDRYNSISKVYKGLLFDQYVSLVSCKHAFGSVECSIQELFQSQILFDNIAAQLTQNTVQKMVKSQNQKLRIENNLQLYPNIIPKIIETHQILYQQLISSGKMRQYVQIELWMAIAKILLCGRVLDLNLNNFHTFFSSQKSKNILQKYAYYPNLFKDIIIAHEKIQMQSNSSATSSAISKIIQQFKQKANSALKQLLHSDKHQAIIKYISPKSQFNTIIHQHLWNLNISGITKKIIHYKQDYSINNLLGMLQTDPIFLQSRMKLTITDHTKVELLDKSTDGQSAIGEWDYPHWFPITILDDSGNSIRVIPKTFFNKFLILPKTPNPNTILYIKSNPSILHKVHKKKLQAEQQSIR